MASPRCNDQELNNKYGKRPSGVPIDLPQELGYVCPKGHGMDYLTWSEFNDHIWCYECNMDYHYAKDCRLQRMCWMTEIFFADFVKRLPIKPQILEGIGHYPDCYINVKSYKRARTGGIYKTQVVKSYQRLIDHVDHTLPAKE
jgi:hypothetical protein